MIKRMLLFVMVATLVSNILSAQNLLTMQTENPKEITSNPDKKVIVFNFTAHHLDSELEGITPEIAGNHPFGAEIAKKLYLFTEKYTSQVPLTPGNPAVKTVIRKPVIYESVRRIERDLKRQAKKGAIAMTAAADQLNMVLDVALNVVSVDTRSFEEAIETSSNTESKIELFTKRVFLNY
jgi:hypothetical protein